MNTFTFNTKQEYLAWRAQWRADYKALSERIREIKAERKDKDPLIRASAQSQCYICRRKATQMLEARKDSKLRAQELYLAAKAQAAAA